MAAPFLFIRLRHSCQLMCHEGFDLDCSRVLSRALPEHSGCLEYIGIKHLVFTAITLLDPRLALTTILTLDHLQ